MVVTAVENYSNIYYFTEVFVYKCYLFIIFRLDFGTTQK